MLARCFEDLEIWKEARLLTKEIYRLTSEPKFSKDFNLRGQIQSAAVSVMSNIAEGFERGGTKSSGNFFTWQKVPAAKCDRNCMWQLTRDMSQQKNRKT
jgi:hypothetical protein